MIAGSSANLATPAAPTCTVRTAQSNETALNTTIDHVLVAATNYFGTTAVSGSTAVSITGGQVVDVTIAPVAGALQYNIWGLVSATYYLLATCGGVKYTLQGGTLPASATQPTTDSGTGKPTRMEGVIPVLSGVSAGAGVYPRAGPAATSTARSASTSTTTSSTRPSRPCGTPPPGPRPTARSRLTRRRSSPRART